MDQSPLVPTDAPRPLSAAVPPDTNGAANDATITEKIENEALPSGGLEEIKVAPETAPSEQPTEGLQQKSSVPLPELQDLSNVDVTELTTQILEMINQDDESADVTKTGLMKKNVELQEFMVKLIELLRDKTNLSGNLERQNEALTKQAKSLRDVIAITKDLLNIRNMEVEHLHVDMNAMEKSIKEERERHNLAVQRLNEAMTLNDKLKKEYLNQMELFKRLREKFSEKVSILTTENQNLKELLKQRDACSEDGISTSSIVNLISPDDQN